MKERADLCRMMLSVVERRWEDLKMSLEHSPAQRDSCRLHRPPAAAEFLGIAVQTLARWRVEGTGPSYVKLGARLIAYPEDALREFVSERRRSTSEPESARQRSRREPAHSPRTGASRHTPDGVDLVVVTDTDAGAGR
jgi:predicted DNA-binding transcriptional regulator AlpA